MTCYGMLYSTMLHIGMMRRTMIGNTVIYMHGTGHIWTLDRFFAWCHCLAKVHLSGLLVLCCGFPRSACLLA